MNEFSPDRLTHKEKVLRAKSPKIRLLVDVQSNSEVLHRVG